MGHFAHCSYRMITVGSWTGGRHIWCDPIHYCAQLIDVLYSSALQMSGFGLPVRPHQAWVWMFSRQISDVHRINLTVKSLHTQRVSNSRFCTSSDRPTELRGLTEQCSDVSLNDQGLRTRIELTHGIHDSSDSLTFRAGRAHTVQMREHESRRGRILFSLISYTVMNFTNPINNCFRSSVRIPSRNTHQTLTVFANSLGLNRNIHSVHQFLRRSSLSLNFW